MHTHASLERRGGEGGGEICRGETGIMREWEMTSVEPNIQGDILWEWEGTSLFSTRSSHLMSYSPGAASNWFQPWKKPFSESKTEIGTCWPGESHLGLEKLEALVDVLEGLEEASHAADLGRLGAIGAGTGWGSGSAWWEEVKRRLRNGWGKRNGKTVREWGWGSRSFEGMMDSVALAWQGNQFRV
jgi:hypothetical protein